MTRILKTSGFLGLAVMMSVGLHQVALLAGGSGPPPWMVGMHAHLGVLSILAIVTGFAADAFALTGTLRRAVTGLYVTGQWLLPGSILVGEGMGVLAVMPTMFLWGACLIVSMLIMAWQAWTSPAVESGRGPAATVPADD